MSGILVENLFALQTGYPFDIHTAASIGCEEYIEDIIENESKCVINKQNSSGWTSFMYAACSGNLKVISFLLDEGASMSIKNNLGHTALILAAKYGNTDAATMLLNYGANVNDVDLKGWSALSHASFYGHRSIAQLLILKGTTIDIIERTNGLTPLMIAATAGHEMIVQDLLQHGAHLSKESKYGDTAYDLSVKNNRTKVKSLLEGQMQSLKNIQTSDAPPDLKSLLHHLHLSKYCEMFERHNIDLDTFWLLTDNDLKEIGIQFLGPRKKICAEIARWNQFQLMKVNASGSYLESKLALERQTLLQQFDQMQSALSSEKKLKELIEFKLNKSMETLKLLTSSVHQNLTFTLLLQEKLKQSFIFLRGLFVNNAKNQKTQCKLEMILPLLNDIEKIVDEINHQLLMTSQQLPTS